jgi:PleD family two-component response regulator
MGLKICLLVTDDMDDHQTMSEALAVVSDNTILLNVIDSQKALLLVKEAGYKPHSVILDLSMHGIKINSILKVIRGDLGKATIPVIVYGVEEDFRQIEHQEDLIFFHKEYSYSDLKEFLTRVFG